MSLCNNLDDSVDVVDILRDLGLGGLWSRVLGLLVLIIILLVVIIRFFLDDLVSWSGSL